MPTLFNILLYAHIAAGSLGLLASVLVIALPKGNNQHRKLGNVFYVAMTANALLSLVLAVLHLEYFLFIVGIFTLYLVLSGKRILSLKIIDDTHQPIAFDWFLCGAMVLFGALFIGFGLYNVLYGNYFGTVFLVFGAISLSLVRQDILYFRGRIMRPNFWLTAHLTKMVAATIAAFTAFLVVNNTILPGVVAWLLPTVIGSALIAKWRRDHARKTI